MTRNEIRKTYIYENGMLYYRDDAKRLRRNKPIGYINDKGYLATRVNGKGYKVHRLIWLYFNNSLYKEIDHINGIKTDNRIENLRETDHCGNMQNRIEHREGRCIVGVRKMGRKWQARIGINRKRITIGVFDTVEEARTAYIKVYNSLTTTSV